VNGKGAPGKLGSPSPFDLCHQLFFSLFFLVRRNISKGESPISAYLGGSEFVLACEDQDIIRAAIKEMCNFF
jgi:hypothetical protein